MKKSITKPPRAPRHLAADELERVTGGEITGPQPPGECIERYRMQCIKEVTPLQSQDC